MSEEQAAAETPAAAGAPDAIPETMKRLVVMEPGEDVASCKIEFQEVPVPKPISGQVLIKVIAAAVNPSDYEAWKNCRKEQCPYAMGIEGCGVVVATGGGLTTMMSKVGTKVGFVGLKNKQGAYSEYVVADAMHETYPMPDDVPIEDAASFFVNPYTAIGILDTVKSTEKAKAFVHTAAASQLGQMIVKLAATENVEVVNVVRRQEQAEMLKEIGAKHVIVTGSDGAWKDELAAKIGELGVTVAMDAVAGSMTGDLLDLLPKKGTVYLYGVLAGKAENINPVNLIYHQKKIKGFGLSSWIKQGGLLGSVSIMMSASKKVNAGLKDGGWSSSQFQDTTMESLQADVVDLLNSGATGKKLRVRLDK